LPITGPSRKYSKSTERKPPPTPKFQPKVIRDSNRDCWINPDPDVCRISPKTLWIHYLVGISHFAKLRFKKSGGDCKRNANKSPNIPLFSIGKENGKVIWSLYMEPEPHQKLFSSSDW